MITTFFVNLYLLSFLRFAEEGNFKTTLALTGTLVLCVLSEIFLISLVLIPLVYFNSALFFEKGLRAKYLTHVLVGSLVSLLILEYIHDWRLIAHYFDYGTSYAAKQQASIGNVFGVLLNFSFFNIGFPSSEVTHPLVWKPSYIGFFKPTLREYFGSAFSVAFLVSYASLLLLFLARLDTKRNRYL